MIQQRHQPSPSENPLPPPPPLPLAASNAKEPSNGNGRKSTQLPPELRQAVVRCPRCDSTNTKFCYYNNYSLTQPRHFCKTCRRYWTKGGALRNVPIGGGCRKHKKSSRSSIAAAANSQLNPTSCYGGSNHVGFPSDQMTLFPPPSQAVEFQYFGSLSFPPPRLANSYPQNHYSASLGRDHMINLSPTLHPPLSGSGCGSTRADSNSSILGLDFNYPLRTTTNMVGGNSGGSEVMDSSITDTSKTATAGTTNTTGSGGGGSLNIATSIESLSSINQELHFKLQQQRLTMLYGTTGDIGANMETRAAGSGGHRLETTTTEKPQPMFFQNLEIAAAANNNSGRIYNNHPNQNDESRHHHHQNDATEWFFGSEKNRDQNGARTAISSGLNGDSGGNRSWCDQHLHPFN